MEQTQLNAMRTLLLALSILISSSFCATSAQAQDATQEVILHLKEFDSSKNLAVYSLFKNDENIEVINSCDILGLIVLGPRDNAVMSRSEVRSYSKVRLQELFAEESFEYRTDISMYEVLMECRAAMQRELDSGSK